MVVKILPLQEKAKQRFHRYVDKSGGPDACWPWTGYKGKKKLNCYGMIHVSRPRRLLRSHRIAYALETGVDPGELYVLHKCDNPPCCNPDHLFLGTQQDNSDDMARKGRSPKNDRKGSKNSRAVLNLADVTQIKRLIGQGFTNVAIAPPFGVTHSLISAIRRGKIWGIEKPLTGRYASIRQPR